MGMQIGDTITRNMYSSTRWAKNETGGWYQKNLGPYEYERVVVVDNKKAMYPSLQLRVQEYGAYSGYIAKTILTSARNIKGSYADYDCLILTEDQLMGATLTRINCDWYSRRMQADLLAACGYNGPVPGGTAKGLSNAFNAIGMPELVKRGWGYSKHYKDAVTWNGEHYKREVTKFGYHYQFKSPRPDIPMADFIRLIKACRKDNQKFAKAIRLVIDNPDAKDLLASLDVLDVLKDIR